MLRTLPLPAREQALVQQVEYAPFKLFQLSLLWRMHIADDPLFKQVDLGTVHADRLRTMLLAGEAGRSIDYPCGFFALTFEGRQRADFINVWHYRRDGHHEYGLVYAGYVWAFRRRTMRTAISSRISRSARTAAW